MICSLSKDINNCPFCNLDKMECNKDDTKCAFQVKEEQNEVYKREARWYEKYYKGSRPVKE